MDKQQAKHNIQEIFEKSFDKELFTLFVKNLLNRIEEAPFTYQGQYIPESYRQYIRTLERIGKFNDGENRIDILVIKLQKETSIERARTMQRNFVAGYLQGKYGSSNEKEAALVAFVSPDEEDWRFSLVKMDYKFEQTKTGRMKVKEEFTPARRWSFLVGANENSHTAQSRLVDILAKNELFEAACERLKDILGDQHDLVVKMRNAWQSDPLIRNFCMHDRRNFASSISLTEVKTSYQKWFNEVENNLRCMECHKIIEYVKAKGQEHLQCQKGHLKLK